MARRGTSEDSALLMQFAPVVWILKQTYDLCVADAEFHYPRETGGAFMGYWPNSNEVVITAVIGPGPKASHRKHSFEPDQAWQIRQIADHYARSSRTEGYVGDWHSHPGASAAVPSYVDKATLQKIIRSRRARAPRPLCAIFYGRPGQWACDTWVATEKRRPFLGPTLALTEAALHLYD
jgi:integrative and conjugative element protein (TIGR02256 family)